MNSTRPTEEAYAELQHAYDFYNGELFGGQLPACLITFQREKRTMGYFSSKRFVRADGSRRADEIAMNPEYFAVVPLIEVMQTLVHEMVHLWQQHFGTPSRACYHNAEWAGKMESVGLMPSDTGAPGGKKTGQKMGDYSVPGGLFENATLKLLTGGFAISWFDRFPASPPPTLAVLQGSAIPAADGDDEVELLADHAAADASFSLAAYTAPAQREPSLELEARGQGSRSNRKKYTCPGCQIGLWGKPSLRVKCADCDSLLVESQA